MYFGVVNSIFSQSLYLDFLFSAGITYSSEFHGPSSLNDSVDFGFNKHRLQFVLPLKTKIGVSLKNFDFKKMDARASQLFLTASVGANQVKFNDYKEDAIYRGAVGVTGITAGFRNGIWLYSANVYIDENQETFNGDLVPNFRGYVTKVKVKSFDFIYFYGGALVVNQGQFFPVPVVGFQKKIAKNTRASLIFPVEAKINYKINTKLNFDLGVNFDGLNTIYRKGSVLNDSDASINYRQLKPYLSINSKVAKQFKLKAEAGLSTLQQYNLIGTSNSQELGMTYYVAVSLNYQIGSSVFGEFFKIKE